MASTKFELAMAARMKTIIGTNQELRATNLKQAEEIKQLTEDNILKDQAIDALKSVITLQEVELKKVKRENKVLHRIGRRRIPRRPPFRYAASPFGVIDLVRLSCTCSFGCFFGMAEDDERGHNKDI